MRTRLTFRSATPPSSHIPACSSVASPPSASNYGGDSDRTCVARQSRTKTSAKCAMGSKVLSLLTRQHAEARKGSHTDLQPHQKPLQFLSVQITIAVPATTTASIQLPQPKSTAFQPTQSEHVPPVPYSTHAKLKML
jgi:hypothetical protein